MGSVRLYAAAALLLAAGCCLCQPTPDRSSSQLPLLLRLKRSSSHYCGSHLASMLEMVCASSGSVGKRDSGSGNMGDFSGDRRPNELADVMHALQFPSYSRPRLLQAVDPLQANDHRRESRSTRRFGSPDRVRVKRQGIVYECCFNACSLSALRSYCNS